jgi:hypothetical protein
MIDRRVQIWIAVVAGLALGALLLLVGRATAGPSPLETSANQPQAVHTAGGWGTAWEPIDTDETITFSHNLGQDPEDYAVELWFRDRDGDLGIHRRNYGGLEANGKWYGAYWQNLTANTIQVHRLPHDTVVDLIRVRVWVPVTTTETYDSKWTDITPGQTITFSHNMGITATDLTVGLWFSSTDRGIHNYGYGGLTVDDPRHLLGAHWHSLTTNTIQVTRHRDDTDIEQVRVLVAHGDPPDYDSLEALGDWQSIDADDVFTFEHNLNWNPNMLLVRGECYSAASGSIHQLFAGGNHDWVNDGRWQGTNLQRLARNTIEVFRQPEDQVCPQVHIRIWTRGVQVYLPLVLQDH